MTFFSNCFGCLSHHKTSLKGIVQDYVIKFTSNQINIEDVVTQTLELVEQLVTSFKGKRILGRLVAKVNYIHVNAETNTEDIRPYHFPSYKAEEIEDVEEFFVSHMDKIASRLDAFNENGSNLIIKNIEHIHIQLTTLS